MRVVIGIVLLVAAAVFALNAMSGSGSSGGTTSDNSVGGGETQPDYSIQQSCAEIRADYMAAEPGSQEERWALEAADEVCFGQ